MVFHKQKNNQQSNPAPLQPMRKARLTQLQFQLIPLVALTSMK